MKQLFAVVFVVTGWALPVWSATIFDNRLPSSVHTYSWGGSTWEMGDEITLVGAERYVTNFSFQYAGNATGLDEARVRFYLNDGLPEVSGHATPGTMLLDSGWFGGFTSSSYPIHEWILTVGSGLPSAGLFLPASDITWSVQFRNTAPSFGLGPVFSPTTLIGSDPPSGWEKYNGSWIYLDYTGSGSVCSFGAMLQASPTQVPEPSVMGLTALAMTALALRRRRPACPPA